MKPTVLFLGTAEFAIPSLEALMRDDRVEVVGVVTQPDRPVGRKQEFRATPVKQFLVNNYPGVGFTVFAPEKLKQEYEEILAQTEPDLIITAAYGQIVPKAMLDYPELGAWNIHGSILPQLRGAVPVHMAILQGFESTGVTIQKMAVEMDAGAILAVAEIPIAPEDTTESLMTKLADLGAELLMDQLDEMLTKNYELIEQNESEATFCYQKDIGKDRARISSETSIDLATRMIRAFDPWPIAWLEVPSGIHTGKRIKIFHADKINNTGGEFGLRWENDRLILQLKDGQLHLQEIQLEGKNRRNGAEYQFLTG